MRSLKLGLLAAIAVSTCSALAQADCIKVAAVGEAPTHGIAELFAKNGLANLIYGKGREGKGPVEMKCQDGPTSTTCRSSQMACKVSSPKTCFGAWLCLPG